jgi:hypothetical protein
MKIRILFSTLLALGLIALAVWLAIGLASWFQSLTAPVAAALISALLGLAGLSYAQWQSKTREIAEGHRTNKVEVYSKFFDILEKVQAASAGGERNELPESLREEFAKLNRGLLLWASPQVIRAWLSFRVISASMPGPKTLLAMDEMYKAIREDLGNSNFRLRAGDLVRIGLKDPGELK